MPLDRFWGRSCREKNIAVIAPAAVCRPLGHPTAIVLSSNPAFAVDECLAAPNAPGRPAGSHWYCRQSLVLPAGAFDRAQNAGMCVSSVRRRVRLRQKCDQLAVTPAPQATQTAGRSINADRTSRTRDAKRQQPAWTPGEQTPTVCVCGADLRRARERECDPSRAIGKRTVLNAQAASFRDRGAGCRR